MKKIIFGFFILFCFFLFNRTSFSQSATTILDILKTATDKVEKLEDDNQEVVNFTIELLVGTKNSKTVYRNLDNSFSYTLTCIPDRKISKLTLTVYKKVGEEWKYYDEDSGTKPELTFKPKEYGLYEISVKADSFTKDWTAGHFALIVYHVIPK
jgi:hypothetical protein